MVPAAFAAPARESALSRIARRPSMVVLSRFAGWMATVGIVRWAGGWSGGLGSVAASKIAQMRLVSVIADPAGGLCRGLITVVRMAMVYDRGLPKRAVDICLELSGAATLSDPALDAHIYGSSRRIVRNVLPSGPVAARFRPLRGHVVESPKQVSKDAARAMLQLWMPAVGTPMPTSGPAVSTAMQPQRLLDRSATNA